MKYLVLNDGRRMEVQSVTAESGVLHARMILQTSEQLKAYFADEFATAKLCEQENGRETVYEGYTKLSYIKEETGGIWEVELLQPEADAATRIAKLEEQTSINTEVLEQAIAEMTIMLASVIPQAVTDGGEVNV